MRGAVVGREAELAAVARLLAGVEGGPAVLVLTGEAGIGKTTVWQAGLEAARQRGFTVLEARPAASEIRLSHAGLSDLLAEVETRRFGPLPAPQRRALDAALLRGPGDDPAPDPRAVAAGFLTLLAELATDVPVLVAIDDVPWLDEPSRRVVAFAIRRCAGPVAVLATRRTEHPPPLVAAAAPADGVDGHEPAEPLRPLDPDRLHTLALGPLSLGALHHIIAERTGHRLARPALVRLGESCGGNPFFALEVARSTDPTPLGPAELPDSLRGLISHRLARLDPPVREALLVAAALAAPDLDQVGRALQIDDAAPLLTTAEDQGVVTLSSNGSLAFTHPLLARGVYTNSPPSIRRDLHLRLGGVVEDPEERARHLALSALGPDPETIRALNVAADHARRRGAPGAAAELLELALGLGATEPELRIQASYDHFHAGDAIRAGQLLASAVDELSPGATRAEALILAGTIRFEVENDHKGAVTLLHQALDESGDHARLRCSASLSLAYVLFNSGQTDGTLSHVGAAVEAAERTGDDGLIAEALQGLVVVPFLLGDELDEATLARALMLEDPDRRTRAYTWPTTIAGLVYGWSHRFDEALAALARAHQRCLDLGAESELWYPSFWAVPTACAAGDIETATRYVDELVEHAQLVDARQVRAFAWTARAHLAAWTGLVDQARLAAREAVDLFGPETPSLFLLLPAGAAALAELSVGAHQAAADWLTPAAMSATSHLREPRAVPVQPDAVEALLALDRPAEAEPLVEQLETSGRRPDRVWAAAVGARCRGLLLAAQGCAEEADVAFEEALATHARLPQARYDRARTLLVHGRHQRRCNQRRAARDSLEEALRLFDEVGCRQWTRNARNELDRLGLRPATGDGLTPTEEHVAELAASGMTVREVAAALYVSPKTVEAHLTRIYRKLDIHSRAELGRHMAERGTTPEPA